MAFLADKSSLALTSFGGEVSYYVFSIDLFLSSNFVRKTAPYSFTDLVIALYTCPLLYCLKLFID
jgi:hypothetical protein